MRKLPMLDFFQEDQNPNPSSSLGSDVRPYTDHWGCKEPQPEGQHFLCALIGLQKCANELSAKLL